jgi:hypothetical protein
VPPTTIAEIPSAALALTVSCAITAVTPANTSPTPRRAAANATDPVEERPSNADGRPTARIANSTTWAAATTHSVAASGACRPTSAERTSSARPLSSSVLVCRTMRNTLISATAIAALGRSSFAVIAPNV